MDNYIAVFYAPPVRTKTYSVFYVPKRVFEATNLTNYRRIVCAIRDPRTHKLIERFPTRFYSVTRSVYIPSKIARKLEKRIYEIIVYPPEKEKEER